VDQQSQDERRQGIAFPLNPLHATMPVLRRAALTVITINQAITSITITSIAMTPNAITSIHVGNLGRSAADEQAQTLDGAGPKVCAGRQSLPASV
jgi:hypothetical protein